MRQHPGRPVRTVSFPQCAVATIWPASCSPRSSSQHRLRRVPTTQLAARIASPVPAREPQRLAVPPAGHRLSQPRHPAQRHQLPLRRLPAHRVRRAPLLARHPLPPRLRRARLRRHGRDPGRPAQRHPRPPGALALHRRHAAGSLQPSSLDRPRHDGHGAGHARRRDEGVPRRPRPRLPHRPLARRLRRMGDRQGLPRPLRRHRARLRRHLLVLRAAALEAIDHPARGLRARRRQNAGLDVPRHARSRRPHQGVADHVPGALRGRRRCPPVAL